MLENYPQHTHEGATKKPNITKKNNPLYLEETDEDFPLVLRKIYEPTSDKVKVKIQEVADEWKEKFGVNTARFLKIWIQEETPVFLTKNGMVKKLRGEDVTLEEFINSSFLSEVNFLRGGREEAFDSILTGVIQRKKMTTKAIQKQKLIGTSQGLSSPNDPKLKLLGEVSVFLDKVTMEIVKSEEYQQILVEEIKRKNLKNARQKIASTIDRSFVQEN